MVNWVILGNAKELKQLYDATYSCLMEVPKLNMTSLALPALGAGIFAIPHSVSATVITNAISDFVFSQKNTSVSFVSIVETRAPVAELFAQSMAEAFVDVQLCE